MVTIIAIFLLTLGIETNAQSCCGGTGTFLGGIERAGLSAGMLTAAAVYTYTAMNHTLNGTQRVPNPNGSIANVHALNVEIEVAPLEKWSILLVLPFTDKMRTINITTGTRSISERYHAGGLSDAFGLVKYAVVPQSPRSRWSVAVGIGAKAPTGNYRVMENGVELPLDVQPGTSTWDLLGWLFGAYRADESATTAAVSVMVRQPGTNINGRAMGTDIQALLTVSTTVLELPIVPILLNRWRWTAPDRQGDRTITATGTFRIELLPTVAITVWDPLVFRIGAQLPVYERTNGIQLVPSWGVFGEARTTLSLW